MTIDSHDGTDTRDHMADLIAEAAERATPEDDSHDGAETLAQARTRANSNGALLAQLGRMLADAIGPEGRHASGKEDLAADLDLLVSRFRRASAVEPGDKDLEAVGMAVVVAAAAWPVVGLLLGLGLARLLWAL